MATRTNRGGTYLRLAVTLWTIAALASSVRADVPGTIGRNTNCVNCHEQQKPDQTAFARNYRSHEFVFLSEGLTWTNSDPHSKAYAAIVPDPKTNPIAAKMQQLLSAGNANYKVTEDVRCLTCHATDLKPKSTEPRKLDEFIREENLGVSCNACHGVTSKWQTEHVDESVTVKSKMTDSSGKEVEFSHYKWRTMTPEYKASAGMNNLRDPHVKADLCASCHVGNPDENKVVTHEIYAAGHPPLPPLELVTFMNGEPRHWGYPSELKFLQDFAKRSPEKAWEIFRFKPADQDNYLARQMVAGALASLKAEMNLLASEAAKNDGLDYARFDCYSCHHDLVYPSPRQQRGYEGRVPGRPPLKAWVAALPGTVITHASSLDPAIKAKCDQYPAAWMSVMKAATSTPFAYGKSAEVSAAAKALVNWTNDFNKSLETVNYSDAAADALLADIGKSLSNPTLYGDTEAVMHLTWAYRSLAIARKKDVTKWDVELGKILPTEIRTKSAIDASKTPLTAGQFLPERLKQFANFDPKAFAAAMAKLKE